MRPLEEASSPWPSERGDPTRRGLRETGWCPGTGSDMEEVDLPCPRMVKRPLRERQALPLSVLLHSPELAGHAEHRPPLQNRTHPSAADMRSASF